MKGRTLGKVVLLFAFCWMLALIWPGKAQAADSDKLYLGGVDVIQNPTGTGYSYNADTKTLTLNNYHAGKDQGYDCKTASSYTKAFFYSNINQLKVELKGSNSFEGDNLKYIKYTDTSDKNRISTGIVVEDAGVESITICGNGSLSMSVSAFPMFINGAVNIEGGAALDLTSYMDGSRVTSDLTVGTGCKVTMNVTGNNLDWPALEILNGNLKVEQEAELSATTLGCMVNGRHPYAVGVSRAVEVYGTMKAVSKGQNNTDDGCQGYGLYVKSGNMRVYDGGKLEARSEGKGKNDKTTGREAIYLSGGTLSVALDGYVKAITNNVEVDGYQHSAIRQMI